MIVPTQNGPYPNEIIMAGKGGTPCDLWTGGVYAAPIYVVDRDNMGKYNTTQDQVIQEVQGSPHGYWSNGAYWASATANYIYSAGVDAWGGAGDYLKMYSLTNGLLSTTPVAQSPAVFPVGATPFVSANGTTNGVVWTLERQQNLSTLPGSLPAILSAYNATNVATQLYSSTTNATRDQAGLATKFVPPTVANGRVYVATQTEIDAYGLLSAATLLPSSLNFALVPIGSVSAAQTATLTNTGGTSLIITSIAVSGEYTETNTCGSSLSAGGSCTISVVFKPTTDGTQTGKLTVVDGSGTQTVAVSGTATPLKFTPASVNFGTIKVGTTSAAKAVAVANVGKTTLTLSSVIIGGTNTADFAITANTCGSSLAAGANCKVTVTFTPTATGTRSANVTIKDNDPVSPQKILLSGTGS
ncbi:MAG TPA: choice-of-anchor D domain-containing protein [Bryobacteraceae bacterium]